MSPQNTLIVKGRTVRMYNTVLVLEWPKTTPDRTELLIKEFHKLIDAYLMNGEWLKAVITDDEAVSVFDHEIRYHFRPCY